MRKHLNEAITAIIRNRFLSAVTIISIAFILLIFNVLLAVNLLTQQTVNNLSERINLTVYVQENTDIKKLEPIIDDIQRLPQVHTAFLQTAKDSFAQIKDKYPDSTDFLDKYEISNPLPSVVNISTFSLEDQQKLIKLFQNEPYNQYFRIDENKQQRSTIQTVINNLINLKSFTFQIILWVILTFTIGGALLIFNVLNVTLFNRRREIQIMQFVGATHKTIRTPFIIEGVLYGILSFILSIMALLVVQQLVPASIEKFIQTMNSPRYQLTLLIELVSICILSAIISIVTVENYLKHKTILSE